MPVNLYIGSKVKKDWSILTANNREQHLLGKYWNCCRKKFFKKGGLYLDGVGFTYKMNSMNEACTADD